MNEIGKPIACMGGSASDVLAASEKRQVLIESGRWESRPMIDGHSLGAVFVIELQPRATLLEEVGI